MLNGRVFLITNLSFFTFPLSTLVSLNHDLLAIHNIHTLGGLEDAAALEIIIVDGGWLMVDGGNANGDIADLRGSLDGTDLVGAVEVGDRDASGCALDERERLCAADRRDGSLPRA